MTSHVNRIAVDSSCIAAIEYRPKDQVLLIEFRSGALYLYLTVPPDAYAALAAADSKGAHLNRFIKGRFAYEKCGGEK